MNTEVNIRNTDYNISLINPDIFINYYVVFIPFIVTFIVNTLVYKFSFKNILINIFLILLILSTLWNWVFLLRTKQAEYISRQVVKIPLNCIEQNKSIFDGIINWIQSIFISNNNCDRYIKDIFIDPFLEVTPLDAFAVTINKFIVSPLEHFGKYLGIFLFEFFKQIPFNLYFPILVVYLSLIMFSLIFFKNYSLSILYGFFILQRNLNNQ